MRPAPSRRPAAAAHRKNKSLKEKSLSNRENVLAAEKRVKDTVSTLVSSQLEQLTANLFGEFSGGKRKSFMSDSDSDSDPPPTPSLKKSRPTAAHQGSKSSAIPPENQNKTYKSQVVILDGVHDALKKNPAKLSKALNEAKPQLEVKKIRLTASNAVLVEPKHPKDCCSLLKEGAFVANSALGANVTARLPRENSITHQVIIKGLDVSITMEEMEEMLQRQELPYKGVKRIISRQRGEPTEMVRLFLKSEEKKKHLLRQGIFLDQMHFKCVPAKEDEEKKLTFQCFNCQAWGSHKTWECKNATKCVMCGESHKRSECTKTKTEAKCCNCDGDHAAWSTSCNTYKKEVEKKKSFSAVASEAVIKPSLVKEEIQTAMNAFTANIPSLIKEEIDKALYTLMANIKKQMAVVVAEVVTKALLEHIFYECEYKKSNGKTCHGATARTASIAKMATSAVNQGQLSPSDNTQISGDEVGSEVLKRLKNSLSNIQSESPSTSLK